MGVWVKTLEFAGMLFIYLKVTSKKTAPEPSVYMYSKHLSMSLLTYKEEGFSLFHLLCVGSDTFQTFRACYGLFPVVPLFTSGEVTEYFDLQFYYKSTSKKECKSLYKAGQLF